MKKIFLLLWTICLIASCKKETTPAPKTTTPTPTATNHTLEFRVYNQPDSSWISYSGCCVSPASFNTSQMLKTDYLSITKTIQQQTSAMTYHLGATPYSYDTLIVQILLDGVVKKADTSSVSSVAVDFVY